MNVFSDVLFYTMVHFVIIISISKVFQVQNKPMGFLPPIQMKGLITMKLIHAEYNPLEYARLALDGEMQAWVDAENSLEAF